MSGIKIKIFKRGQLLSERFANAVPRIGEQLMINLLPPHKVIKVTHDFTGREDEIEIYSNVVLLVEEITE